MPGPLPPGAAGAADAVHIGVAVLRGVEVDDVGDARDVDPAGGDVGGDQRIDLTGVEAGQRPFALALAFVAVHRQRSRRPWLRSRLASRSAPRLVRTKTSVLLALRAAQLGDQMVELGALGVDVEEAVLDVGAFALLSFAWVWRRASRVKAVAILPVAPSSVAEKNSVCRAIRRLRDDPADRRS